jgi:signal transduction histidine kinase
VFRILQEALTNVARHARATEVTVSAWTSADAFMLEICDDGIGIVESKMTSPESLGIVGMRERVEGLGGNIRITSEVGHGTTIALRVGIAADVLAVGSKA